MPDPVGDRFRPRRAIVPTKGAGRMYAWKFDRAGNKEWGMDDEEFKGFRRKLKKTQQQMADLLGVSIKAIHSYEQGWRPVPPAVERQLFFLLSRHKTRRPDADCWDVKKCPPRRRENCPAWEFRSGLLCWFVNGTHCRGTSQNTWKDKMAVCRSCRIFKKLLRI